MVQDRVHQAAQEEDAPGRLLPYGAEQRQLTEDVDSIVVLQLLRQPWRQIPGIRGQWEKQEGWFGGDCRLGRGITCGHSDLDTKREYGRL